MKKMMALLLTLALVVSCAACSTKEAPAAAPAEPSTEGEAPAETPAEAPAETPAPAVENTETNSADGIPASVTLSDSTALQGKKIGCSICYKGDEWCAGVADALEKLGAYYGAEIVVEDGDLNDETMTKQIENMISSGCDIILADPTTPEGCTEALNKAYDAGIPIIIYDGYWTSGEEQGKIITSVTWDQIETGRIVGEYFVKYVKENMDGKCRLVELTNAVSEQCQSRFIGLHEVIDKANADGCEIEIIGHHDSQGNRETAYNAISAIVEPYDFVISDVDNGAMGAVSALQATGNTDVKVISMGAYGAEPFGKLHDNDPNYLACLNVDAWILSQFVFDGAIGYFEGKELPEKTNIDLYVVDNSNVEEFWSF
ncbi:MAG: sugar ABC transporter substrate-binding protein [Lachnospiraceae bacterium]|nr:sugar ABC transporter substrate-binding protein [Lachnospiraceae bacterium]